MENDWDKPYEDDGVTLGPEDALRREIEKIKALKVEKIQLKDTIEKLKDENGALAKTNQSMEKKLNSLTAKSVEESKSDSGQYSSKFQSGQAPIVRLSFFLLIFNLGAIGILLIFLLK